MIGLDVGCGIYKSHPVVDGAVRVDVQRSGLKVDVICDACHLPFRSFVFGFVRMSHMPEHLFDPVGAFRESLRVLVLNGKLLIVVPHRFGRFNRTKDRNFFQVHRCSFRVGWFDAVFKRFVHKVELTTGVWPLYSPFFVGRYEEIKVVVWKTLS